MSTKSGSTKSEADVAAREELRTHQAEEAGVDTEQLEDTASEQEKQQAAELKAGVGALPAKDGASIADNRTPTGKGGRGVQGGFVDQMTRRDVNDVMEGHFCTVDRTHKGINADLLPAGEDGYGVYIGPATTDENGYPVTANVRLRDSSNALVTVPYDALRPSDPNRRS